MSTIRTNALHTFANRPKIDIPENDKKISEYFAIDVFSDDILKSYLSKTAYEAFQVCIQDGTAPDASLAEQIATAMKAWAIKKNTTHYTHWFQPLTGFTAEKHEAFFTPYGQKGIEEFDGNNLIQQEPEQKKEVTESARATFEARGYNSWDISSPAFIMTIGNGKTLCIPTKFVSFTGESLDYKTPLLKSTKALNTAATEVCNYFNRDVKSVHSSLGWEQEYYLIDTALYYARPDLIMSGRTMAGRRSPKGQLAEDHYFGAIPERVYAFMRDFEVEAHRLGIPLRTRHNEIATSQYECAPMFEDLNIAVDHNQLLMDVMDRVSSRHKLKVLFHEKPFAGMDGSSKHLNWSLHNDEGKNLLKPGSTPRTNLQFLTFFINTIAAINKYEDVLRASVASHSNDHRLGAEDAPPAILSLFIGKNLTEVLDMIEKRVDINTFDEQENISLRLDLHNHIPEIIIDNTDSNRTAPIAFTGNKFEIRASGSSVHCALPLTVLNTIVAEQLTNFKNEVDVLIKLGDYKDVAILKILSKISKASRRILFEGDNNSEEWQIEAKKRGISNNKTTPLALKSLISEDTIQLFTKNNILTENELKSRHDILLRNYSNALQVESRVLGEMIVSQVIPAAVQYQNILLDNVIKMKSAGMPVSAYAVQSQHVKDISEHIQELSKIDKSMYDLRTKANAMQNMHERATLYCDEVKPLMEKAKYHIDEMEGMIDDALWTLPKYREMLLTK